ncbi:FUSC family protein [Pseudorhodoferax soli]|uniref:Putative membrane protein YccC n=1 Tax=Pseudorhodoferax soli TaxID=545864 RepID=A0A368Y1R7_9BURK|nr:FUSC family membrane protein [Pseudorhodoferax soli]RCW74270.1 putative membrane protein YccC [Pseudorhodoferax soli]
MTSPLEAVRRWLVQLPAYGLNGIGTALGVLLVQLLAGALGGLEASLLASGGAIYASLADTPNPPHRTWRRVAMAAAVGLVSSVLITALRGHAVALGGVVALLAFGASMLLAWGPRAGPISFVPVLAIVFTMAGPAPVSWQAQAAHALWTAFGSLVYLGWALVASRWLQPRYRALALAAVVEGTAALLRSRAAMLSAGPREIAGALPLQDWMQRQVALDERLQPARDLLFSATEAHGAQRQIAILLHAIALRDTLLGSELDLDLLGDDAAAERLRLALAARIAATADTLHWLAQAVQWDRPMAAAPVGDQGLQAALTAFADDPRRSALAAALGERAQHIADDLNRMLQTWRGQAQPTPLSAAELQFFVSPEGWPLAALAPHRRLSSPILRQALRSAAALGTAYFLALALPWASHPHWLVLSVAVVLRGNLDQTLARRDARVAGTVLGCLLVLLFAWLGQTWLSGAAFLLAVGVAHAFVNVRYLVTATAATMMALLQAHMAHPAGGYAIGERLADTLLGALLAWGFCYVLPAWERRSLTRLGARVQEAARVLAAEALRWPEPGESDLALRLARREFYEAIGSIAASAQRSHAEPTRVQLPVPAMATLLTRCHVLLAQLSAVRTMLERRRERLDAPSARQALVAAQAEVAGVLAGTVESGVGGMADAGLDWPDPQAPLLPWLQRRLQLVVQGARGVRQAAEAVRVAGTPN